MAEQAALTLDGLELVVPCYQEAARLDLPAFSRFLDAHPGARLRFVDDGSTDGTAARLTALAHPRVVGPRLLANVGKGEAVLAALLAALDGGAAVTGWWDADLATPLTDVGTLWAALHAHPDRVLVLGARVKLLGRDIVRKPLRHYLGRVAATLTSWLLALPVYDTQCGAKLLRDGPGVRAALSRPFRTRWTFDVELLVRLLAAWPGLGPADVEQRIVEVPVSTWRDVPGGTLGLGDVLRAPWDLLRIAWHDRPWRRGQRGGA